jgi:hypothetical protein
VRGAAAPSSSPPFHAGRRLSGIGLGLAAWLGYRWLSRRPELAEAFAGTGIVAELGRGLSRTTGWVPLSLAELFVLAFLVRQGIGLVRGGRGLRAGNEPPLRAGARAGARLAQDLGILVFFFYLLWGVHYARPGLEPRLGLEPAGLVPVGELHDLMRELVERTNRLYHEVHGRADTGEPSPGLPFAETVPALESAWARAHARWNLPDRMTLPHGRPKTFLATPLVRRFGIAGMYFPFTGEALVVGGLPGAQRGKETAHEMAHQRGVARESDANVLAYLVTREAEPPEIRYAGALFLQRQFVAALAALDSGEALRLAGLREPGVQRDVEAIIRYRDSVTGPVSHAAHRLNHAMLQTHGIPEGVASYRGSVWVVAALAARDGMDDVLPRVRE